MTSWPLVESVDELIITVLHVLPEQGKSRQECRAKCAHYSPFFYGIPCHTIFMPPVILEARDVIGGGRYLQEVRISTFSPTRKQQEGIRYSLCLVDLESGNVILLYDVHRGKSHHRHLRGNETGYKFVDEDTLLSDFLRDVNLILEGNL